MKQITLFTVVVLASSMSMAKIQNSQLKLRHQNEIENAAIKACNPRKARVVEISTISTPVQIDQGVTDYLYKTDLEVYSAYDQNLEDRYTVTVWSYYTDGYDHGTKQWGSYSIERVSDCVLK